MGNYSYLIYTFNCKNTKINFDSFRKDFEEQVENVCSFEKDTNYGLFDEDIKTLEDYANYKNNHKFIQYLTPITIKTLCLLSLNTVFTDETISKENPRMYFEYEGWDQIYFLEFELGTENIYQGCKSFNFDNDLMYEILKTEQREDKIESDNDEIESENYIYECKRNYMLCLILDKFTKWERCKLDFKTKEINNELDINLLLNLFG